MIETQQRFLLPEMERVKHLMNLTPEERKLEVRRQMYKELRPVEMERRKRVAWEKFKKEREEREKATEEKMRQEARQREEEERRRNEEKALETERLQWKKVMMVNEELVKKPKFTISALKEEQQRRREEAELCHQTKVSDKASPENLTSDLKAQEQEKKTTLRNNWVRKPLEYVPDISTYLLFTAKPVTKPRWADPVPETPQSSESLQWLPDKLKPGYWMDKYRVHREKKDEKRTRKAEEQYARWTAYKTSRASHFSQQYECYTGGFATGRNSILKSIF